MTSKTPNLFSNNPARLATLNASAGARFGGRPFGIVWVTDNATPGSGKLHFPPDLALTRVLIVFEGLPIELNAMIQWRRWAVDRGTMDVQVDFAPAGIDTTGMKDLITRRCGKWDVPVPKPESAALKAGSHISMGKATKDKDDPDLLTMMFGSMGELLTRVDLLRMRFRKAVSIEAQSKARYLKAIDALISSDNQEPPGKAPDIAAHNLVDHLPRLLLRGETGVGKTLIARFLQDKAGSRPPRIAIPEYLNKEDSFEYALFGYAHGSHTGGREDGDHGLLLENVGGVIFLDEIGEANSIIQAKLLAYLDDYRVRPRGWSGEPFYCPTLIVAATNRDLVALAKKGHFRGDLLARFTDIETIPPLRERVESLPFILDCLLQREAINPGSRVEEIGVEAFKALATHAYPGNFRELESTLRGVCLSVIKDGRNYICRSDLPF